MRKLVVSINLRKSKYDESACPYCESSERTQILKAVQVIDKTIDKIISDAKQIFNPIFSDYDDAEIVFMIYKRD